MAELRVGDSISHSYEPMGYLHRQYAESLREFGEPLRLARADGWILKRPISGTTALDGTGCYPLFCCHDWSSLKADLDEIGDELVSVVVVADPFGNFSPESLALTFDFAAPFKEHFVADLQLPISSVVSKHHRYYARKTLRDVAVEVCATPVELLDDWCELYRNVIQRHRLKGIQAFSREAFAKQLAVPGLVALRAVYAGRTVAAQLWYLHSEIAYSHLTAANDEGYRLRAIYGLYWHAISHFRDHARWIDWGGGAGTSEPSAGLAEFKRGWANQVRVSYLCGRIFNRAEYERLSNETDTGAACFFPRYRAAENA